MIRKSTKPQSGEADTAEPQFKENAQVNARIDEFIKNKAKVMLHST